MQPKVSLPLSQVLANCPYPEPARSSPYPTPYFLKIHHNIILPSTPGSLRSSVSLRFPYQDPVYIPPLPQTRYMPLPSHCSRFSTRKILGEEYRLLSSSLCSFLHSCICAIILHPTEAAATVFVMSRFVTSLIGSLFLVQSCLSQLHCMRRVD